jgi:hypothetical protein
MYSISKILPSKSKMKYIFIGMLNTSYNLSRQYRVPSVKDTKLGLILDPTRMKFKFYH